MYFQGSSHSSLSSNSSTESCDACSIHSNTSLTTTSCCEQSVCHRLHNNNNIDEMVASCLQSPAKCLNTPHRTHSSSQIINVLTQDLPHVCFQDIDEENKENAPLLMSDGDSPVLKASSDRDTVDIRNSCICEPMDVSMETQSPCASSESAPQQVSLIRTPVLATPTCIRA